MAFLGPGAHPLRPMPTAGSGYATGGATAKPHLWRWLTCAFAPFLGPFSNPTYAFFGSGFRKPLSSFTGGVRSKSVWGPAWEHTNSADQVVIGPQPNFFTDESLSVVNQRLHSGGTLIMGLRKTDATFRNAQVAGPTINQGQQRVIFTATSHIFWDWAGVGGAERVNVDLTGHTFQQDHVYAFSGGPRGHYMLVDGTVVGSNGTAATATGNSVDSFSIGNGVFGSDLLVYGFFYVFDVQLDLSDIAALSADPGLLFRPVRPAFTAASQEAPSLSWFPSFPDRPIKETKVTNYTTAKQNVLPVFPVPNTPTTDIGWLPDYPDFATKAKDPNNWVGRVSQTLGPPILSSGVPPSWLPIYQNYVWKKKNTNDLVRTLGTDSVFIQPVGIPLTWLPKYPDFVTRAKSANPFTGRFNWSSFTPPAPLSWLPKFPDRVEGKRRPQYLNRYELVNALTRDAVPWNPVYPNKIYAKEKAREGFKAEVLALANFAIPDLSWEPTYPSKVYVKEKAREGEFRANVTLSNLALNNTSWNPTYPNQYLSARDANKYLGTTSFVEIVVSTLAWLPRYPDKIDRLKTASSTWIAHVLGLSNEPIPFLAWNPVYPDRLFSREKTREGYLATVEGISQLAVPSLSWFFDGTTPRRLASSVHTKQSYFAGSTFLEPIPLSWKAFYQDQYLKSKDPNRYTGLIDSVFALGDFATPVLAWSPTYPDRLFLKERTKLGYTQVIEGLANLAVPSLSWEADYPSQIPSRTLSVALQEAFAGVLFVPPRPPLVAGEVPWIPIYPSYLYRQGRVPEFQATTRQIVIIEPVIIPGRIGMRFRLRVVFKAPKE